MMATGGAFKVDTLIHNLKELQQEKSCLEQKLNELRAKRRDLEGVLESVNAKQAQVRDTNLKMIETLKIAQHKVMQTQSQANSIENSNTEKRSKIAELNESIQKENQVQLDEVKDFQKSLREITINLNDAKQYFAEDNLQVEISATDKEITENDEKVGTSEGEIKDLEEEVNQLSLSESRGGDYSVYGVPLDDRKEIWKMLKDENNLSIRYLDDLETQLKHLAGRLRREQECENENTAS